MTKPVEEKRAMIDREDTQLSIVQQCELLGLHRPPWHGQFSIISLPGKRRKLNTDGRGCPAEIDRLYLKYPFYGSRRMAALLSKMGYKPFPAGMNRKGSVYSDSIS